MDIEHEGRYNGCNPLWDKELGQENICTILTIGFAGHADSQPEMMQ